MDKDIKKYLYDILVATKEVFTSFLYEKENKVWLF